MILQTVSFDNFSGNLFLEALCPIITDHSIFSKFLGVNVKIYFQRMKLGEKLIFQDLTLPSV